MTTLTYEQIPDASSFNAEAILGHPFAEYVRQTDGPYQPYAAYMLSVEGKNDESERALIEIIENADPANVWLAKMELGTLIFDVPERTAEANHILMECVGCPFLDVARNAAWNISEVLKNNGHEQKAKGYSDLAVNLHNGLAMTVVAERLQEAGLEAEALEAFEFAAEHTSRIDAFRPRIEAGLASSRTADVKPQAAEYFAEGLGALLKGNFASSNIYVNTSELFNTEVGSAAIATRYFDECEDQCYFEPIQIDCATCGRNPKNYLAVPSGDGDGVYPVFTFLSKDAGDLGSITIFRGLLDDLIEEDKHHTNSTVSSAAVGYSENWARYLGSGTPLVLGTLEADTQLIFSDGSKCSNDRELAVVVEAQKDVYSIICWLSAPDVRDKTIRPLAMAAVRGQLRADLLEVVPELDLETVNMLREELWGHNFTVHANASDLRRGLAIRNFEVATEDEPERLSWLLQQAEFIDDGLYQQIRSQNLPSEAEMRAMLARRGMFEPKLPWYSPGLSGGAATSTGLTKISGGGLGGSGLSGGGSSGGGLSGSAPALAKFCVSCGTKFEGDNQKFCGQCGNPR